jgi:hypothetical protein
MAGKDDHVQKFFTWTAGVVHSGSWSVSSSTVSGSASGAASLTLRQAHGIHGFCYR